MKSSAIICLGNRFVAEDDLGCRVFDYLAGAPCPAEIEVIDGGLCGLDLLSLMEGRPRVVFADAVSGMGKTGEVVVLEREAVAAYARNYGHGAGLPYLLGMLPMACRPPLPQVTLVGAEGPADEATVRALASRCLEIAAHETA